MFLNIFYFLSRHLNLRRAGLLSRLGIVASLLLALNSNAAPHPGMGSSVISNIKNDLALSLRGYRLGLNSTVWAFSKTSLSQEKDRFELTSPQVNSATIEIIHRKKRASLKSYLQKSNKDYYHFGFEMRGQRDVSLPNAKMILVDLFHRKENMHLRQMILEPQPESQRPHLRPAAQESSEKNRKLLHQEEQPLAVITCKYDPKNKESLKNCNELGSLFSWISQKDDQKSFSLSEPLQRPPSQ